MVARRGDSSMSRSVDRLVVREESDRPRLCREWCNEWCNQW